MQYPTRKFLAALTVGRGIRFYDSRLSRRALRDAHHEFLFTLLLAGADWFNRLAIAGALYALYQYKRAEKNSDPACRRPKEQPRSRMA